MTSAAHNEELTATIGKLIGRLDRFIVEREAGMEAGLPPFDDGTHKHILQTMIKARFPELLLTQGTLLELLREVGDEAADL